MEAEIFLHWSKLVHRNCCLEKRLPLQSEILISGDYFQIYKVLLVKYQSLKLWIGLFQIRVGRQEKGLHWIHRNSTQIKSFSEGTETAVGLLQVHQWIFPVILGFLWNLSGCWGVAPSVPVKAVAREDLPWLDSIILAGSSYKRGERNKGALSGASLPSLSLSSSYLRWYKKYLCHLFSPPWCPAQIHGAKWLNPRSHKPK